ncbi:hypothetical protein AQUCO_04000112v1 [Aquilegia coerulea]|uniref:Uncharacterized protein n=1 Tax=Aquilegia coerulea TaxID=218851 RepID=A0A2G5CR84_AQUCA|nr:hypothetical protein AQUCO_04000112v1 [Aquilegia coerulea]
MYSLQCGKKRVSKICILITMAIWISAAICASVAISKHSWLWIITVFKLSRMNFRWKSTEGWSIGNILLDMLGGKRNYVQMAMQSIDQGSSLLGELLWEHWEKPVFLGFYFLRPCLHIPTLCDISSLKGLNQ